TETKARSIVPRELPLTHALSPSEGERENLRQSCSKGASRDSEEWFVERLNFFNARWEHEPEAASKARQRRGVRQSSGAFDCGWPSKKRQWTGALHDLAETREVHEKPPPAFAHALGP